MGVNKEAFAIINQGTPIIFTHVTPSTHPTNVNLQIVEIFVEADKIMLFDPLCECLGVRLTYNNRQNR